MNQFPLIAVEVWPCSISHYARFRSACSAIFGSSATAATDVPAFCGTSHSGSSPNSVNRPIAGTCRSARTCSKAQLNETQ